MISTTPDPEDVKQAIAYRCADCWGALSFANAIGGQRTPAWALAHGHSLKELVDHAAECGISLEGLKAAVTGAPVESTMLYRYATGAITREQFREEVRKWKEG